MPVEVATYLYVLARRLHLDPAEKDEIIQELEGAFRGAGGNVIKVIWGDDWDALYERDDDGLLARRMNEIVDGEMQRLSISEGAQVREQLFGHDERLLKMVEHLSDEQQQGGQTEINE